MFMFPYLWVNLSRRLHHSTAFGTRVSHPNNPFKLLVTNQMKYRYHQQILLWLFYDSPTNFFLLFEHCGQSISCSGVQSEVCHWCLAAKLYNLVNIFLRKMMDPPYVTVNISRLNASSLSVQNHGLRKTLLTLTLLTEKWLCTFHRCSRQLPSIG